MQKAAKRELTVAMASNDGYISRDFAKRFEDLDRRKSRVLQSNEKSARKRKLKRLKRERKQYSSALRLVTTKTKSYTSSQMPS